MSESESELTFEEARDRLSVVGGKHRENVDVDCHSGVYIPIKIELPPNVTDRSKDNKRASKLKMEEQYRAQIEALKQELAQAKQSAQNGSQVVASGSTSMSAARVPDFRELKEYVSTFDPKIPSCLSADTWVKSIDDTGDVYEWSAAIRLHCARLNLGGCAKLWLESCPNAMRDWISFKAEIVKGFPSKKNPIFYHNLLSSRKWKLGETVEEYVYEMLAFGRKGGFDEETTVTYITSGLRQYVIRSGMTVGKVATVEQLLEELRWIDSVDAVSIPKPESSSSVHRKSESFVDVCFQCHQVGHIARRCPKVMCHLCKKEGHMRKDCPTGNIKREVKGQNPRPMRVVDQKSVFVKNVLVGGLAMKALIDTGGKVSTIQEKFAKNVGEVKPSHKVLRGFGKKEINVTSKVCAEMQVDDVTLSVELQVVPTWVQDTAVILGEDIIDRDGLVMVKRKGDVRFEWEAVSKPQTASSDHSPSCNSSDESSVIRMYTIDVQSKVDVITEDQINSDGPVEYNKRLCQMVDRFRDCFALRMNEMGCATSAEMKISLISDEPVYVKPRKLEYVRESVLSELVHEMLEGGIIAETESPYNSQVVLVPKKNNDFRLAVDYRLLNARTIKDKFPMPDIESCLQKLAGAKLFITVDLYSGYYQIPLEPASQNYTAFSTVDGHYRFLRMPFGLSNGCAVFQRAMNKIVEKMRKKKIVMVAYIDDLILPGNSEEDLLTKFEQLLVLLREDGFTINVKKSQFFKRQVEFLGFEVSAEGVRPGERKIKAVSEFSVPKTVFTVQQFLGLSGFFRRFVQNYSIIAEPLFRLLRKEAEFVWTVDQQQAFERIKQLLVTRPILVLYDQNAEVELHTDASSAGVAGILLQKVNDGWKPVSYFSKKNSKTEAIYHSYELEMLAVVASVERFRQYLVGRFFVIKTDCSAIRDAYSKKELNKRVARYFLKLLEYNFRLEHRAGLKMQHVDALSRSPTEEPKEIETVAECILVIELSNTDFLVSMQRQDSRLVELIDTLARDPRCDEDRQIQQNYVVENNRLFRKVNGKKCWVVPNNVRWRIVRSYHDEKGHFGEQKVFLMMKELFWFPKMRKYVRAYIAACPKCAFFKSKQGQPEGFLNPIPKTPVPFHTVHLDHLGPFPRSAKGHEHLLVVICGYTKFVLMKAVKSTNAQPVVSMLEEMSCVFGLPSRIVTDRGTAFTSNALRKFCEDYGIDHVLTAVGTPRGNGQVERCNRTILTGIRTMVDEADRKWDEKVRAVQSAINTAPNATTGVSPTSLVLLYRPKDVVQNEIVSVITVENENMPLPTRELRERVQNATQVNQARQKKYFDEHRRKAERYQVNDLVLVAKDQYIPGGSRKLEPRFKGPFIVTKVCANDRYCIETVPGFDVPRRFTTVYSADRMKRWCNVADLEDAVQSSDEEVDNEE